MNEWAARLLSVFPERTKADLDEFVQQVANDQAEHMYFNKEYDAEVECRPTFAQLSQERIINEANKNINVLKALENIINDRMTGYTALHNTLMKTNASYELLENVEGTLKVALDSLFMFTEQEMMHCKQHVFLSDLRKSLNEMRTDAQRRITDYQKEISTAEKEVISAEKRLAKSKEALERSHDHKAKMESFELDVILNNSRPVLGISGFGASSANLTTRTNKEAALAANTSAADEAITRIEKEMKDDIRNLLRSIEHRDHILSASRRAFQKLHRECKTVAHLTLLKVTEKEAEQADQRRLVLDKLYRSVNAVDIDADEHEFIETHSGREGALVLSAQALSLLGDLLQPPLPETMDGSSHGNTPHGNLKPGMYTYTDANSVDARSQQSRDQSPQVRRVGHGDAHSRSPPTSPVVAKNKPTISTPSASSAVPATTPSGSTLPSSRFSFRRTLGLTSDSSSHASSSSSITVPIIASPAPHPAPTPTPTPTSAVVAAGKVGGGESTLSGASRLGAIRNNNATSAASANSSSVSAISKEDFTAFLSQIFYSPGGSAAQKPTKSKGAETESVSAPSVPSVNSAASLTSSSSLECTIPETDGPSGPTTPKILIDDNYFSNPSSDDRDEAQDKHQESLPFAKTPPICDTNDSPGTSDRKNSNRHSKVTKSDLHCGALDWLKSNPHSDLIQAVEGISKAIKTQAGRDAFTTELNQFRSKKVEVGEGFEALGAVLWTTLSHCQAEHDIHNASVIMMLSQTFYKKIEHKKKSTSAAPADTEATDDADTDGENARGVENRRYIKDLLVAHPLWKDGNYWEKVLWQCAIEQLQTIPYDRPWHDMTREVRRQAVRRVHEVIFSQVMAITHSMLELGCSAEQSREFLYRMCVIHQLSEAMRQSLLKHVASAAKANARRPSSRRLSANSNSSRRSSVESTEELQPYSPEQISSPSLQSDSPTERETQAVAPLSAVVANAVPPIPPIVEQQTSPVPKERVYEHGDSVSV